MRREFRDLFYIVSHSTEDGEESSSATWTGIAGDKYYRNAPGADFTTVSNTWLDENVRSKGFLGETYPYYIFIMEGDTPSFLGLLNNGLASYRNPGWGGWGGRYIFRQPFGESQPIWTQGGDCFPGKPNSRDTVIGVDGQSYTSDQATIWRWRKAFQHDFAARMDWTLKEFARRTITQLSLSMATQLRIPSSSSLRLERRFPCPLKGAATRMVIRLLTIGSITRKRRQPSPRPEPGRNPGQTRGRIPECPAESATCSK